MYDEEDLLPLSALNQFVFCERRCALIHVEGEWKENQYTAEGEILHEKAHGGEAETKGAIRIRRSLRLRSLRLGLTGVTDVVEFHEAGAGEGVRLIGEEGWWMPYPVEYKRGKPKPDDADEVQLCGQALCLEEMLKALVERGALYYGQTRRRQEVAIDAALRARTEWCARELRALIEGRKTPPPIPRPRCHGCSFEEVCMPEALATARKSSRYVERALSALAGQEDGDA